MRGRKQAVTIAAVAGSFFLIASAHAAGGHSHKQPPKAADITFEPLQVTTPSPGAQLAAAGATAAGGADLTSTVIYRSTMPDGRTILGDRPVAGATKIESSAYTSPQGATASGVRAAQEREYWRQRAEAFASRQRERETEAEARRESIAAQSARTQQAQTGELYGVYGGPVFYRGGVRPLVGGFGNVNPNYTSTPGASLNRGGGFIGSGFATSRN